VLPEIIRMAGDLRVTRLVDRNKYVHTMVERVLVQ
jgi:hypothetical protein